MTLNMISTTDKVDIDMPNMPCISSMSIIIYFQGAVDRKVRFWEPNAEGRPCMSSARVTGQGVPQPLHGND